MSKITRVVGTAVVVRGNDIDTDRIVPARYLKEITFDRMGEYPFYDERFDSEGRAKPHPFNDPRYQKASVMLVNQNFGCGSSREHAPQALCRFGIRAVVGESFAPIFSGNCFAIGLLAVTIASDAMAELMPLVESNPEVVVTVDLEQKVLLFEGQRVPLEIPESTRKALVEGSWDSASMLLANIEKVRQLASRLPYMTGKGTG